ncbi:hypothetical protein KSP40_PGU016512 [Platanthera guangdongensis]|uniref:Ycf1 n=1 Tax=Platanthera guangdongensis TaxID=2320717 RepID=A0ABR2LVG6_9ASPA
MTKQRAEQGEDPDYEYWSVDFRNIIINAWIKHGNILKNIDSLYPSEDWIKHLKSMSLRESVFKENLVNKNNPRRMPSKYIPKLFMYFKRQDNKAKQTEWKAAAQGESSGFAQKRMRTDSTSQPLDKQHES